MLNDTARTVEERYTRATTSSNLRCKADERSDVDILIACAHAARQGLTRAAQ